MLRGAGRLGADAQGQHREGACTLAPLHPALPGCCALGFACRDVTCVVCCGVCAQGNYDEDLIFPTLHFPSDHGIVISELRAV